MSTDKIGASQILRPTSQQILDGDQNTIPNTADVKEAVENIAGQGGAGLLVGAGYDEYTDITNHSSAVIPLDSTTPDITEGVELTSITHTAKQTTNKIKLRASGWAHTSGGRIVSLAVFKNNTCIQVTAQECLSGTDGFNLLVEVEIEAGDTNENTYSVRAGKDSATGNFVVNQSALGATFNGATKFVMFLEEIGNTAGSVGGVNELLHVRHEEASGVEGGDFTAGSFQTRTLNATVSNDIDGASLNSNVITLPPGTYEVDGYSQAYDVGEHRAKLVNTTDSVDLILGTCLHASSSSNVANLSNIKGRFTLLATKTIELQHRCGITLLSTGLGRANGYGGNEVYAELFIRRITSIEAVQTVVRSWDFESAGQSYTSGTKVIEAAHGLGVKPKEYEVVAVCTTADLNYSVGDEITLGTVMDNGVAAHTTYADDTVVGVAISTSIRIAGRGSGAGGLTNGSWDIVCRANVADGVIAATLPETGWEEVATASPNGVASVEFDDIFELGYIYKVALFNIQPANDGTNLGVRFAGVGNSYVSASGDYEYGVNTCVVGVGNSAKAQTDNAMELNGNTPIGNAASESFTGEITLIDPMSTEFTTNAQWIGWIENTGNNGGHAVGAGAFRNSTGSFATEAVDSIRFAFGSGNIADGEIKIYRRPL